MKISRHWFLTFVAALALSAACTTQKGYAPDTDAGVQQIRIHGGDEIRVVTTRRERFSFKVTEVRGDRFVGVTVKPHEKETRRAGLPVEVPFDELAMIEVTRVDKVQTALAAALVTVSAFAVVVAPIAVVPAIPPPVP